MRGRRKTEQANTCHALRTSLCTLRSLRKRLLPSSGTAGSNPLCTEAGRSQERRARPRVGLLDLQVRGEAKRAAELDALVKRHAARGSHLHRGLAVARVLERGRSRVVVDEVPDALPRVPDLPAFRKGLLVLQAGRRSGVTGWTLQARGHVDRGLLDSPDRQTHSGG